MQFKNASEAREAMTAMNGFQLAGHSLWLFPGTPGALLVQLMKFSLALATSLKLIIFLVLGF